MGLSMPPFCARPGGPRHRPGAHRRAGPGVGPASGPAGPGLPGRRRVRQAWLSRARRPPDLGGAMSVLSALVEAIRDQSVEVIDLTAPLNASTPVIRLPEPFGNTRTFALHEISRYDDRGPAWYWNDISTGEHTGTHFDAPVHWVTGASLEDVAQVPAARLLAPAAVLDFAAEAAADPDFLLEVDHIKQWESEHGPLPEGGWLLY